MALQGLYTGDNGYIVNQAQLLQEIADGLAVYNQAPNEIVDMLSWDVFREQARVPQAPLFFEEEGQGALPDYQGVAKRELIFPLRTFDTMLAYTKTGVEDSLAEDILADANAAMAGDAQRVTGLAMAAVFRPRTAGSIGTPYTAAFYNGETDVPPYGEKTFSTAHSHYAGVNSTTLSRDHILQAVEDVAEHGFKGPFVGLFSIYQADDVLKIQDSSTTMIASPGRIEAVDGGTLGGTLVGGVRCVFSEFVPAGYFAVVDAAAKPLGRRQHVNPAYRGLRIESQINDPTNPLVGKYFRRRIGFAVRLLGAGAVRQIVASTTYTAPTMRFQ